MPCIHCAITTYTKLTFFCGLSKSPSSSYSKGSEGNKFFIVRIIMLYQTSD